MSNSLSHKGGVLGKKDSADGTQQEVWTKHTLPRGQVGCEENLLSGGSMDGQLGLLRGWVRGGLLRLHGTQSLSRQFRECLSQSD